MVLMFSTHGMVISASGHHTHFTKMLCKRVKMRAKRWVVSWEMLYSVYPGLLQCEKWEHTVNAAVKNSASSFKPRPPVTP